MSYNANDPNQQWQQPVDPNNQQHLQFFNQQATPASSNPGGDNYQQSQQSYTWTDGSRQGQHHSSQQSWSWQGQTASPAIQSPPAFSPLPMLLQSTSHQQLHQQMHQNGMNHSQQALAHHQQAMNMHQSVAMSMSNMSNMASIVQQTPQLQVTYQSMSPQPQPVYQQSVMQSPLPQQAQMAHQPALLMGSQPQSPLWTTQYQQQQYSQQQKYTGSSLTAPTAAQPQLQYPQSIYQQSQSSQSPYSHESQQALQQAPQQASLAQPYFQSPYDGGLSQSQVAIQQQPHGHRFSELERQRIQDIENMNRAGVEINKRLRDLELNKSSIQNSQEAKDQEVHRIQGQLAAVERQRSQDAERNSQQLAELVRSQATSPSAQAPALDMRALEKAIRETLTQQLSAQNIEGVIEEQVSKRLAGMATKADIHNAGAQMQNALSQVPAGLNEEQVQQAVNRELNSVMQDVANRVNQQRRIAGQMQQDPQPWQNPQHHVQTEFVIEELPDGVTVIQPRGATNEATALTSTQNNGTGVTYVKGAVIHGSGYPTSAYNENQAATAQSAAGQYSGGSQYAAIDAGQPASSTSGHRNTMIKASSMAPDVPGTALTAPSRFVPAETDPSNTPMPAAASTRYDLAQVQPQFAAAQPALTYDWGVSPSNQTGAATPQRQLEATHTQMPQIAGVAPQLQLEAPTSASKEYPTTGQELVYQSRDLERQPPRR